MDTIRRLRQGWCVRSSVILAIIAAGRVAVAQQAGTANMPDMSGSYERYRGAPATPQAPPPPLKPQYLKDWQAKQQAAREADAKGEPIAAGVVNCIPEGMPGMMAGPFPMEILQSKGQVTIVQEAYTQVRRIVLDQPQKPIDEVDPSFFGHSVGRWEGNALVVDTVGIKEYIRYLNVPHSSDMRIKERIHPVAPDIVWDEITIEDPAVLEKPWSFTFAYKRMPGYTLLEYVCEDNREFADEQGRQKIRVDPAKR
jgi:hypothetical protein